MTLRFLMTAMSVTLLLTLTATSAQGFVQPAPVAAQDQRSIKAVVGPDVSSVPAGASFTGKERWELTLSNFTALPLTGAQISLNSTYDLTDSNLFRFFASLQGPGAPPGPPVEVPCTVTLHDAACPQSPSSQVLPAETNLFVQPNMPPSGPPPPGPPTPPWLAPGVPTAMTPGFDSAVSESAFSGGTASLHFLVTLRDAARYTNAFEVNLHIDGNAVPGSETVTSSSGPVPVCGTTAPPGTCYRVFYGPPMCNDSRLGDGSANFFLDEPQVGETYDFGSTQTATPTCPNPPARPHVNVGAQQAGAPCPGGPTCSPNSDEQRHDPGPRPDGQRDL